MYKPQFYFKDHNILDGEFVIAEFQDCSFRNIRLSPQGDPVFSSLEMSWRIYHPDELITSFITDMQVEGQNSENLILILHTQDSRGRATDHRTVTLTYDSLRNSYVFDVAGCFMVADGMSIPTRSTVEFADPVPIGAVGPAFDFPGKWEKRWDMFVYDGVDGNIYQVPHHHLKAAHRSIKIPRGGRFALVYDNKCNPVLEIPDETASDSFLGICPWIYDIHMFRKIGDESVNEEVILEEGKELPFHFRIYMLTPEEAKEMLCKSRPALQTVFDNKQWRNLPPVLNPSSFNTIIDPYLSHRPGDLDPFHWYPIDNGKFIGEGINCFWDRTIGCSDDFSVRIERREIGISAWCAQEIGPDFFAPPWPEDNEHVITGYVRTENVKGNGAYIAAQFSSGSSLIDESKPFFKSRMVTQTNDWTELKCVIPTKASGTKLLIELRLDGVGKAWFDDISWSPYGKAPMKQAWRPYWPNL